jgi:hypothetical protein
MNTVVVNDPRINVSGEMTQVVSSGGQRLTQYVQTADSNSTSNSSFSFQPPSVKTVIDRHMLLRVRVRLTAVGGEFQRGTASALRQAPLASITDVLSISLNGGNISDNISRRIHSMLRYNNDVKARCGVVSTSPMMPDQYQRYGDWQDPVNGGSARNPLAAYGENSAEPNRGGFVPLSESPTVLEYELTEAFFMSPFLPGLTPDEQGFVNINQIDVNIKYINNLERIFSHYNEAPNNLTGINVEFINPPQILVTYITVQNTQPLPLLQVLPYYKMNDYIKNEGTKAAGETFDVNTNTIKLNQVPRHMTLCVKRSRATESFNTADAFARIDSLDVLWNNESSLFSTYQSQGLFNIAKGNGCNLDYPQWVKFVGGVLRIEFSKDLGTIMGISPGTMGQYTLSATLRCTNVAGEAIEFESFLTTTLEGSVEIASNSLALNLGNLDVSSVVDAENNAERIDHTHPALNKAGGGSFWSSLKNFIHGAGKGVNQLARMGQMAMPALAAVAPQYAAPLAAGLGMARAATGGGKTGGSYGRVRRRMTRRR